MTKYHLIDSDGYVVAVLECDVTEYHIDGKCYTVTGWSGDEHTPVDLDFLAEVYCKWDACTHWNFYGEDYYGSEGDKDSYYHLCGKRSFSDHIRAMCFVWKVAGELLSKDRVTDDWYHGDDKLNEFIELILEGYTIEEVEVDE